MEVSSKLCAKTRVVVNAPHCPHKSAMGGEGTMRGHEGQFFEVEHKGCSTKISAPISLLLRCKILAVCVLFWATILFTKSWGPHASLALET